MSQVQVLTIKRVYNNSILFEYQCGRDFDRS
jgi:hypothetical protein